MATPDQAPNLPLPDASETSKGIMSVLGGAYCLTARDLPRSDLSGAQYFRYIRLRGFCWIPLLGAI
jgi:hypothetical protein